MTVFQILVENGFARILQTRDKVETPILLPTDVESNKSIIKLKPVILTERGLITFNLGNYSDYSSNSLRFEYETTLDEWSILLPRLTQNYKKLEDSYSDELSHFLSRIKQYQLPQAFGLPYNPISDPATYFKGILELAPSIIVLRIEAVENLPARKMLDIIVTARKRIPPNIAIYLPGGVPIGYQGLMIALGIDILDDAPAYRSASRDITYYDRFYKINDNKISRKDLIDQNLNELRNEFTAVLRSMRENTLWTRIGRDMHSRPSVASAINIFIKDYLPNLNKFRFGSNHTNSLHFTGDEGLYHPDVLKFHKLVVSRYKIDSRKQLIVLLPCSAKKPYRESKSHKIFEKIIRKAAKKNYYKIEIWSLTSPIGVVPRDLETIYPAGFYDLPVTGDWSEEESRITGNVLSKMLFKIPENVEVIVHVSKGYSKMVQVGTKDRTPTISWMDHSPTSLEAQKILTQSISSHFENVKEGDRVEVIKFVHKWQNEVDSILQYNHGKNVSVNLSEVKFHGRPPRPIQVKTGNDHLLSWDVINGKIKLSPLAASEIAAYSNNWIITDTHELQGTTLFSVGILDASEKISPNDEVLIFNSDKTKLLGVGKAMISGYSMNRIDSGIAAKIKKKCQLEVIDS
ncbi:MAG: DUF5591 domain-containing protein [Candidatus Kariarchaeaceae archaeon]|jgi:archaeosine synthase